MTVPVTVALCCPKCGNDQVGENDVLEATAQGGWFIAPDGQRMFDPAGYTEVCWDSQKVVERAPCFCEQCCWAGKPDQLVPACQSDECPGDAKDTVQRQAWGGRWRCAPCREAEEEYRAELAEEVAA